MYLYTCPAPDHGVAFAPELGITFNASNWGIAFAPEWGIAFASEWGISYITFFLVGFCVLLHVGYECVLFVFMNSFVTVIFAPVLLNMCDIEYPSLQKVCHLGGYKSHKALSYDTMKPYLSEAQHRLAGFTFHYIDHTRDQKDQYTDLCYVQVAFPLHELVKLVPVSVGRKLAELHGMSDQLEVAVHLTDEEKVCHKRDQTKRRVQKFREKVSIAASLNAPVKITSEDKVLQKREQTKLRVQEYRERTTVAAKLNVPVELTDEEKKQQKRDQTKLRVQEHRERGLFVANLNAPVKLTDEEKMQQKREQTKLRVQEFRDRIKKRSKPEHVFKGLEKQLT
ncbi:hypothetical protein M378DRAFT_180513 [Amanita muscaria Koide BX008]|uniref:Uncharacterized protein n=1 Tax=Amanita muscaria (strain Koide BX008) TaxID=946122 RepID=A0A0C2WV37_AMAMK|nr:hypothetical protein M378DRAFT_180513 [Amanita muscaria Koide BX008]